MTSRKGRLMCKKGWLRYLAGSLLVLGLVTIVAGAVTGKRPGVRPQLSILDVRSDRIVIELTPPNRQPGLLEVELYESQSGLLAKVTRRHTGTSTTVELVALINTNDLGNYSIRYRCDIDQQFTQRSLIVPEEVLETIVLGQRELVAGSRSIVKILVRDRSTNAPVAGAMVQVELLQDQKVVAKSSALTSQQGHVDAVLDIPDAPGQVLRLRIDVTTSQSKDLIEQDITITSPVRTMLTTDKPIYQPGQTIHIRALSLASPRLEPVSDADVLFEVEDSKGNKVFKAQRKTDRFGISYADFVLADELNMGTYKIRAIVAGSKKEKAVAVERYVLPKFKIEFQTDCNYYQPGQIVKGQIQADYFFGKPVAGGKVKITCAKFDVAYVDFHAIEGRTDEKGHYSFEVRLPDSFVGQPLEAGRASAKFEISITDNADHKQTITRNITITGSPILIAAIPEAGHLIPGLPNHIYVVTTYPDGTPVPCQVTWQDSPVGTAQTIRTDEGGFGQFTVTPTGPDPIRAILTAKDQKGQSGHATVQLPVGQVDIEDAILLRTDKTLYQVGQEVQISIFSTRKAASVYLDLIKDCQTYLTQMIQLENGQGQTSIALDQSLVGTVQISGYLLRSDGQIVRDRRILLVDRADDLRITVDKDSQTYLPGSNARLTLQVKDRSGNAVPSALGVIVVDEAVFALQEMQPGLEKVYFYLEKQLATPRYEIHGYNLPQCIIPSQGLPAQKDTAAKILLASAQEIAPYSLHVNTFVRDNKMAQINARIEQAIAPKYQRIRAAIDRFSIRHQRLGAKRYSSGIDLGVLIEEGFLERKDATDPWGRMMRISGNWQADKQTYSWFQLTSAGLDGRLQTADDVTVPSPRRLQLLKAIPENQVDELLVRQRAMAASSTHVPAPSAAEPVRLRQYFPETLYFNPAVITDAQGRTSIDIPLADSITTWRLSCMASSAKGQLGSTTTGIRVFQEFFVDIDFPVALTQNDQIHVPIAVYNYLATDQTIRLVINKEDWFELDGLAERTVTIGPSEVRAVYIPITARKVGFHRFTVTAYGSKSSDAVARSVEVVPDGAEHLISLSGRLAEQITHVINIPQQAIEDASKVFLKIYPGVLSQVAEGLDQLLRMPFGCFEQTSSVTYPNVLVLEYMKATGKITPELQMKAEGFINTGYQRLLSFEVEGGGFSWFGNPPAHRILTAYGLMEFYDMSKVYQVDPAVILRTQQWLTSSQEPDGSYKPSTGGIREGAIDRFTDDIIRNTAYITWALSTTGYRGQQVQQALTYLKARLDEVTDNYTLALVANAFAAADPNSKATLAAIQRLVQAKVEEGDLVYWHNQSETPTYGHGKVADIELTALAVQALLSTGQELGTVTKAISYLVKSKDAFGTWHSTQATIQALRAMLMAEKGATMPAQGTVTITHNGRHVSTLQLDKGNTDLMHLVDMKQLTCKGDNIIGIQFNGSGALLYQLVGRYYLPQGTQPVSGQEPMTISLEYDRTMLATNDILTVTATVKNNRPASAQMVIVDLGLPPGFRLIPDLLDRLVKDKVIEKYSVTGRQIIVYISQVLPDKPVQIRYQLLAKYPLKTKTPIAAAYEYYNPTVRCEASPSELVVVAGK